MRVVTYTIPSYGQVAAGFDSHRYWIVFINQRYDHYTLTVTTDDSLPTDMHIALAGVGHPESETIVAASGVASISGTDSTLVSTKDAQDVLASLVLISRRDFIAFAESRVNIPLLGVETLTRSEAPRLTSAFSGAGMTATWVLHIGTFFGSTSPLLGGSPIWPHECAINPKHPRRVTVVVNVRKDVRTAMVNIDGGLSRIVRSVRDKRLRFGIVQFSVPRGRHTVTVSDASHVIDGFQLATCVD